MPLYDYRCENGHNFEVLQRMADDPVSKCQECGAPVERVFHPVAVHFKGSGFYTTDYGKKKTAASSDAGGASSSSDDSKKKDSKQPAKSESSSSSSSKSD